MDGTIARDAVDLLQGLNYNVEVVDFFDSARAMISKGFLEEAKVEATKNVRYLKNKVSVDVPLLGIEPSAILGFRDEYLRMVDDAVSAQQISENTFLMEEFLSSEIGKSNITAAQFTSEAKNIKIHIHCHQKAMSNQKVTFDILNIPENYKPTIITSGCCGMAGSFGLRKRTLPSEYEDRGVKVVSFSQKGSSDYYYCSERNRAQAPNKRWDTTPSVTSH